jgi:PncC family amidohydrolase
MGSTEEINTAGNLVRLLTGRHFRLVTAESCTAGLVAETITRIPGASACFWGSFVCYTPEAKITMLGIGKKLLEEYGPVSGETARAMALGALAKSGVDAAVSVTGLAGPGGDGSSVPVGTVWIATALKSGGVPVITVEGTEFHFTGSRDDVRRKAARKALEQITVQLSKEEGIQ